MAQRLCGIAPSLELDYMTELLETLVRVLPTKSQQSDAGLFEFAHVPLSLIHI